MAKTWFITGCSRGFGRHWAEGALKRGDRVAATARRIETLDGLVRDHGDAVLPLALDVTDRSAVFAAVAQAEQRFGGLDVVVNNAGYGLFGAIEEVSEAEARAQIETNVFGALWVSQAAISVMRRRGSGRILQVSSIGGIAAFPILGLYHASKWALEALSDSLAQEVAQFGIRVTIIEPGPYDTDWRGDSAVWAKPDAGYEVFREARRNRKVAQADPAVTTGAILKVVDAEEPPLRLFLGTWPHEIAAAVYEQRLKTWRDWEPVSREAQG